MAVPVEETVRVESSMAELDDVPASRRTPSPLLRIADRYADANLKRDLVYLYPADLGVVEEACVLMDLKNGLPA